MMSSRIESSRGANESKFNLF